MDIDAKTQTRVVGVRQGGLRCAAARVARDGGSMVWYCAGGRRDCADLGNLFENAQSEFSVFRGMNLWAG